MAVVTAALLIALIGYSVPSNMLVPLLTSLETSYRISAVAAIWISLIALLSGAAFVPSLCRLGGALNWKKSMVIVGLGCLPDQQHAARRAWCAAAPVRSGVRGLLGPGRRAVLPGRLLRRRLPCHLLVRIPRR
jgi:hypothetical protein